MKTITIGRGDGCDILIDDYRISRRHAILRVYTFGKMEIVDMGQNGTWVNGVKLKQGVPFPVKRSDVINFAGASQLNWSQVENPLKYYKIGGIIAIGLLLLGLLVFWLFCTFSDSPTQIEEDHVTEAKPSEGNFVKDSVSIAIPSTVEKPTKETENQVKRDGQLPKTVQELFPNKEKKEKKEVKKKTEKTLKPHDTKKAEEKSTVNIIY